MFKETCVGFIGGGNMGEALIKGLISASLLNPDQIYVYDISSSRLQYLDNAYKVRLCGSIPELAKASNIVVLAVKPQNVEEVLAELRTVVTKDQLLISIAAGVALKRIAGALPESCAVVRVMPNTPALVLEGASALSKGKHVSDQQMQQAMRLFQSVGKAIEVDEKWMDTVTGLSGSGPAYVLLFMEALIDGGVLMGLPRPIARDLAVQTVLGTARMVLETQKHPAELSDLITSPGGTTITGLKVLQGRAVRGAIMEAVEAATLRSKELGAAD